MQRSSGILSACNMQISNSKLCESKCYNIAPLVDEHALPPTGFAVAWLGCSLHFNRTQSLDKKKTTEFMSLYFAKLHEQKSMYY